MSVHRFICGIVACVGMLLTGKDAMDYSQSFKVPKTFDAPEVKIDFEVPSHIRPIVYEGALSNGKPTKVFAWYGVPTTGKPPFPAVVLVHGGGGTAFSEWVRRWNERGFAAIAMDTCGNYPTDPWEKAPSPVKPLPDGMKMTKFTQLEPVEEQWGFQAVSAIIRAHSLLRSFPEVDAGNIGITGISWGGWLTEIVAGVDGRLRYAIPVYGCGFQDYKGMSSVLEALKTMPADWKIRWLTLWNPANFLAQAKMPCALVALCDDVPYPLQQWVKTYMATAAAPQKYAVLLPNIGHSHQNGDRPEVLRLARAFAGLSPMPPRIENAVIRGRKIRATFSGGTPPFKAEVYWVDGPFKGQVRDWKCIPATIKGNAIEATLPAEAHQAYINLIDAGGPVSAPETLMRAIPKPKNDKAQESCSIHGGC